MAPPRPAAKAAPVPSKKVVEAIRDATGARDDEINAMLAECNWDVNEATSRLIDSECCLSGDGRLCCLRPPPRVF